MDDSVWFAVAQADDSTNPHDMGVWRRGVVEMERPIGTLSLPHYWFQAAAVRNVSERVFEHTSDYNGCGSQPARRAA